MRMRHRFRQLTREIDRPIDRQSSFAMQQLTQRFSVHVLHDEVRSGPADRVLDRSLDAGVVEPASYLELAAEAIERRRRRHDGIPWQLQDYAPAVRIERQGHLARGAVAEQLDDSETV
jgi:transcription initiation factor TFIIIB Brf1 subunit/transcription initiation factor TFIIB